MKSLSLLSLFVALAFAGCAPVAAAPTIPTSTPAATSLPIPTMTPTDAHGYIGLEYPPLPDSIKTSSSWEIGIQSYPNKGWGISTVADGNGLLLWLTKTLYEENGKHSSQVRDVAMLPPTASDQEIVVSACLLNGVLDSEIVALVWLDEESLARRYLTNPHIVMAWRANQTTGKLEQMATTGIECYADTFIDYPQETP